MIEIPPVHPITYFYIIMLVTSILSIPLSIYKKDGKLGVLIICIGLAYMGMMANLNYQWFR